MRKWWLIFRQAISDFIDDHGMKLSASLSYYTVFSLGPVLVIIISLAGIIFGRDAVRGKLFYQLNGLVGNQAAQQIQEIIQNIEESQLSTSGVVIGVIILVVGATGVFAEIQDSINYIWSLKAKPKQAWLKLLINRFISFSLVISFGFIVMVSLAVHALTDLLFEKIVRIFNDATVFLFQIFNYIFLYFVIATLFAIIFKVLPDGRIRWRDAYAGAFFTATLFLLGKFLIGFYLGNSNVGMMFGTAASIVIVLLWVYYSSIILFFGAEFTKIYTLNFGGGIIPDKTAVFIVKQEVQELTKETLEVIKEDEEKRLDDAVPK